MCERLGEAGQLGHGSTIKRAPARGRSRRCCGLIADALEVARHLITE